MTYGEGLNSSIGVDAFNIPRPTIELPLDEILNADNPVAGPPTTPLTFIRLSLSTLRKNLE